MLQASPIFFTRHSFASFFKVSLPTQPSAFALLCPFFLLLLWSVVLVVCVAWKSGQTDCKKGGVFRYPMLFQLIFYLGAIALGYSIFINFWIFPQRLQSYYRLKGLEFYYISFEGLCLFLLSNFQEANVRSEKNNTKLSSNTLLHLVLFFSERTLRISRGCINSGL